MMDTQITVAIITGLFGAFITPLTVKVIIPLLRKKKKD
jgi:predicted Na+-dependent transporter